MPVAVVFQRHAAPEVWAAFSAHPNLNEELGRLVKEGQAGWPQIAISPEDFAAFLARQLPKEAAEPCQLAELRAGDLYLVCAFGLRHPAAQAILDTEYMPRVRELLVRLGAPEEMIKDIQQDLYTRLIERQYAAADRQGYSGRGALTGWLCTCAAYASRRRMQRSSREASLEEVPHQVLPKPARSPEVLLQDENLKAAFREAFRGAVAALTSRERNLLRYHFLAQLSIDQIGSIYHVHRSTAARWVTQAQERLVTLTRGQFLLRAQANAESLPRIMEQIHSLLSLNLGKLLKEIVEPDPPAGGPGR